MKQVASDNSIPLDLAAPSSYLKYILSFITGLLVPLGFAPFHLPGMVFFSLAFLYGQLLNHTTKQAFGLGFVFGLGYFSFGVSWVIVSIHDYGNMNYILAGIPTLFFILYLALFPALVTYLFKRLQLRHPINNLILFSTLWCLGEWLRANLLTGFPWLLIGTAQMDTPIKYLFPIFGIYGASFWCCLAAAALATAMHCLPQKRLYYLSGFVLLVLSPLTFKNIHWTTLKKAPLSIGAIQANLAMRDKWDEALFWNLLKYYRQAIDTLLGRELIILPESAIPLPASYLEDYLSTLHSKAQQANSSLLLGILQPTSSDQNHYYNAIMTLGQAKGEYIKRHLVPFGEYIPSSLAKLNQWLHLPEPNIVPGKKENPLIRVSHHPIASLICYEIAYPALLRRQMPMAEWIISISDNGWFGHSLASYQQLQMAQILALSTGRFHVVVNNDGLSSVINERGLIIDSLPPFSSGILKSVIFPALGTTPWIILGDYPVLLFCSLFFLLILFLSARQYPKK